MEALSNLGPFVPDYVSVPWYQWPAEQATTWSAQAVALATDGLRATRGSASWDDFDALLSGEVFRSELWRYNAVLRRFVFSARMLAHDPIAVLPEHLERAYQETRDAVGSWHQDPVNIVVFATQLGVDPVEYQWVSPAQTTEQEAAWAQAQPQPEFSRDFKAYVEYYFQSGDHGGKLPAAATVGSWFGRDLLPEAIVARFAADFPQGVPRADGTVIPQADVQGFYLGATVAAATRALNDDDLDPAFVQEILDYLTSDAPLDERQLARVKTAIDQGLVQIEDED